MPPNNNPTVAQVEQALEKAAKGVKLILLGDPNMRLIKLFDVWEE